MEDLMMCRICLIKNVRLQHIINTNLQQTYERLTAMPFETKDKPIHVCYICYARLQNSRKLQENCLHSEQLLTKMIENKQFHSLQHRDTLQIEHQTINFNIVSDSMEDSSNDFRVTIETIKEEPLDMLHDGTVKEELIEDDGYLYGMALENTNETMEENKPWTTNKFIVGDVLAVEYDNVNKEAQGLSADVETTLFEVKVNSSDSSTPAADEMQSADENDIKTKECTDDETTEGETRSQSGSAVVKHLHRCDVCLKYFCYKSSLTRHKRRAHVNKQPQLSAYEQSLRNKADADTSHERKMTCDLCQKIFKSRRDLNEHISVHADDKPHKCSVCHKGFSYKSYLSKHMRTHTGEKPFKCSVCDRGFSNNQHLKYHLHYTH